MSAELANAMATAATSAVAATAASIGQSPSSGRLNLNRNLPESEVEELISDQLVGGCVLMDKSCPACVTPLLKHVDTSTVELNDENSLKHGKSRDTTKSALSLTPIDGVPFCVACQAHVVTSSDEIDKVDEKKQSLKDLVLTALALDDEPLFICSESASRRGLLKEMEDDEQGYEVIRPEQWRDDPSVRSRFSNKSTSRTSKKSAISSKSLRSTPSQKRRMKRLAFEFADDGDVEIVRASSVTPKESISQTSRKSNLSIKVEQPSIKEEEAEDQREDENVKEEEGTAKSIGKKEEASKVKEGSVREKEDSAKKESAVEPDVDCHKKEITITPDLVDKTPASGKSNTPASSISEIDVKRECSVDAEELTADFLTFAESEDELLSYEEKKSIAAKALGVKMMQGYSLLEKQCPQCSMPLTEFKGAIDCVVCPALQKKAEKVKHQRDKTERERVRVLLETQLLQQRKLSHAKKNRLYEKTRHLNEVSAHLNSDETASPDAQENNVPPTEDEDEGKSLTKVATCQTGVTGVSTLLESPTVPEDGSVPDAKPQTKAQTRPSGTESKTVKEVKVRKNESSASAKSEKIPPVGAKSTTSRSVKSEGNKPRVEAKEPVNSNSKPESVSSKPEETVSVRKRGPFKRSNDRNRPKRPVMGIVKVTPQPSSQKSASLSLSPSSKSRSRDTAMSVRSDKPQLPRPIEDISRKSSASVSQEKPASTASKRSHQPDQTTDVVESKKAENSNAAVVDTAEAHEVQVNESHDDSTKVSSLHSDSTISTKSRTFRKTKVAPSRNSVRDPSVEVQSIAEDEVVVAVLQSHAEFRSATPRSLESKGEPQIETNVSRTSSRVTASQQNRSVQGKGSVKSRGSRAASARSIVDELQQNPEPTPVAGNLRHDKSLNLIKSVGSTRSKESMGAHTSTETNEKDNAQDASSETGSAQSTGASSGKLDREDLSFKEDPSGAISPNGSEDSVERADPNIASVKKTEEAGNARAMQALASVQQGGVSSVVQTMEPAQQEGSESSNDKQTPEGDVESLASTNEKSDSPSEVSRQNHWECLRAESKAFLARRCLVGWKLLPETCDGKECGGVQLVMKGKMKECVICGGTGTGIDGVYALLIPDVVQEPMGDSAQSSQHELVSSSDDSMIILESEESKETVEDQPLPSASNEPDRREDIKLQDKDEGVGSQENNPDSNRGLEDISVAKSAVPPMSPTVMSIRSSDMSIHTGVTITQLHKDFESKRSAVSKEISVKISQGWTLLNLTCPRCVMPLMLDCDGRNEVCLVCGVVGSQDMGGGHSVVTAATDASSAKSKDTTVGMPTEDEFSVQSRSKWHSLVKSETLDTCELQSKRSESSSSDIKDRILRSSMYFRRESPRGDPPAARGHSVMRRTQLEVEDSRKDSYLLPLSVATGDSAVDVNAKAHGPSPSVSSQKMDSNTTNTDKESQQKEDEPIIILVEDDASLESPQNEGATEENRGDDHGREVFAVAIPKSVDVSRGETATQILKAAKSSDSAAGLSIDSRPSPGVDSVYRLPSPGMTEASLPKMSPGSQRGHTTPNSDPRSRAASRVSYTSSQKTHPWGNTQEAKAKRHLSQPAASTQKMTHSHAHFVNQEIKQQGSFTSSASGRRRVTPESLARRPRKDRLAGRSTPVGAAYRVGRASPTDSPIMQTGYASMMRTKQPMRMPLSESSLVVSSESSSSSSCLLRVAVDKPVSSSSSANSGSVSHDILECGGGPVINLDDMDVGSIISGTRSVTSDAIDQLLARIEDTQVELVAAEKEEDGIHKQQRLKELLGRLSAAAAAIQVLDTGSRLP